MNILPDVKQVFYKTKYSSSIVFKAQTQIFSNSFGAFGDLVTLYKDARHKSMNENKDLLIDTVYLAVKTTKNNYQTTTQAFSDVIKVATNDFSFIKPEIILEEEDLLLEDF